MHQVRAQVAQATVREGQIWSMSSGFVGRVRFRIVSVDGDKVISEGIFRGKTCRRELSAKALSNGLRASRMEIDETGKVVAVQPRDAAILRMSAEGMTSQEMAKALGMPVGSVRRVLAKARARQIESHAKASGATRA